MYVRKARGSRMVRILWTVGERADWDGEHTLAGDGLRTIYSWYSSWACSIATRTRCWACVVQHCRICSIVYLARRPWFVPFTCGRCSHNHNHNHDKHSGNPLGFVLSQAHPHANMFIGFLLTSGYLVDHDDLAARLVRLHQLVRLDHLVQLHNATDGQFHLALFDELDHFLEWGGHEVVGTTCVHSQADG